MSKATVIPFGPQHPVLPEPLHLDLVVQDETVVTCSTDRVRAPRPGEGGRPATTTSSSTLPSAFCICAMALPRLMPRPSSPCGRGGCPNAPSICASSGTMSRPTRTFCGWALPPTPGLRVDVHALLAPARARARPVREDHRGTGHPVRREGGRCGARHRREPEMAEIVSVLDGIRTVHADHEHTAH